MLFSYRMLQDSSLARPRARVLAGICRPARRRAARGPAGVLAGPRGCA